MQPIQNPGILQTENGERQKGSPAVVGRQEICRVPTNHRQAERKLIALVRDGTFQIDPTGQIWRLRKKMGCRWHGTKMVEVTRRRAEHKTPLGYLQINARIGGKRIHASAHRLVWQFFFGSIPDGMVMNHINGIKDDNRPENLEVVTYSENMIHAHKNRLIDQHGERNPNAKLSNNDVKKIRDFYATGKYFQTDLASIYGVSFQTISKIIRGERRANQLGPINSEDHRLDYMKRNPQTGQFIGKKAAGHLLDGREHNELAIPAGRKALEK